MRYGGKMEKTTDALQKIIECSLDNSLRAFGLLPNIPPTAQNIIF
jgi:hypothetical protein